MIIQKTFFNKVFICTFFFVFISCIQNPEAKLQNERIKDLQDKNQFLLEQIKEQSQKIDNLEQKMIKLEINGFKKIKRNKSQNNNKIVNDTTYIKIVK